MSEKKRQSFVTTRDNVIVRREESSGSDRIFSDSNKVWISGIIEEEFVYSHQVLWEKFYKTKVRMKRKSGKEDRIPIIVSDLLMTSYLKGSQKGKYAEIGGQFRSFNNLGEDDRKHLELFLFVTIINIYEDESECEDITNANLIFLDGFICKSPAFRVTPLGRQITDLMIAVNRSYSKSDYIPCIAWGRLALYASELVVGNRIKLYGRVQSKVYFKRFSLESEEGEYRTAYEVSIMSMSKVKNLKLEN